MKPRITGPQLLRLRRLWHKPVPELAKIFGVCNATIHSTGHLHGFPRRVRPQQAPSFHLLVTGARLRRLRQEWRRPIDELAVMFGVCSSTIVKLGRFHGFPKRYMGRIPKVKIEPTPLDPNADLRQCLFRCPSCLAIFQGDACPNGHRREGVA